MVKVKDDLTGKQFGRLAVIEQAEDYISPSGQRHAQWLCECSCQEHTKIIVKAIALKRKDNKATRSCGCLRREAVSALGQNKKYNEYLEEIFKDEYGNYRIGFTSNTNKEFYIDAEDFNKVKDYLWYEHIHKNGYHSLETHDKETKKTIRMHYFIAGKNYDHADRNPLNNRKYNLRPATFTQNRANSSISKNNTSKIIGVSWHKQSEKWEAFLKINGRRVLDKTFKNKKDAIVARLKAEKEYYGEFAPQRHLFEEYNI